MRFVSTALFAALFAVHASADWRQAKEVPPELSAETRAKFEAKLAEAKAAYAAQASADALIWVGRRTAYLGRSKEAIFLFSRGIAVYPQDARFYRHRGHRLLTLRCFAEAAADFEKGLELTAGKPDEVEPDGLPNAKNIPTSTLQFNLWYHLGLARYLQGDFEGAVAAYRGCLRVSRNPDTVVATTHWLYMALQRAGREGEAGITLGAVPDDIEVIEDHDYLKLLHLYLGKITPEEVEAGLGKDAAGGLSDASLGYGLANWHLYNGRAEEARRLFGRIVAGKEWSSFGYVAAEAELARANPD
jgi:tetratricopeptide (TPR) repeat protein